MQWDQRLPPSNAYRLLWVQQEIKVSDRQILRDKYGVVLGEIRIDGSKQTLFDRHFNRLGEYDSRTNRTVDKYGNPIGQGNLLVTLLK